MRSRTWALVCMLLLLVATAACGGGQPSQARTTPRPARTARPTFTPTSARTRGITLPATSTRRPTMTPAPEAAAPAVITPTVAAAITPTAEVKTAMLTVANPTLNVRQGPGTTYAVIGQVKQGQQFAITGKNPDGSWWQFDLDGKPGWVIASMVTTDETANSVQVAANIPEAPTPAPLPPTAPPAPKPTAAPASPAPTAAPPTKFASNGLDMRPPNNNSWITVWCRVWNSSRNGFIAGTLRVMRGGQSVHDPIAFRSDVVDAYGGISGTTFKYNDGCKMEIRPVVEGTYTAVLVDGDTVISDPIEFNVSGTSREFVPVWQQK